MTGELTDETVSASVEKDADVRSNQLDCPKQRIYMDEALSQTKFGVFNYLVLFVAALILSALFMDTCGLSFVLPVCGCDLDITAQQKGLLGGVGFFGIICSSHLWGFLADVYGRKRIMQPTLLLACIASFASSFVSNYYLLAFLRFVNGVFISGSAATIYAYLGEFHDAKRRSRAIMISAIIYGIVCTLLPFVALLVINQEWQFEIPVLAVLYKPWRLFLVICSLPGLIAWLCLFCLPESPKFVLGQGDQTAAMAIVAEIHRRNNGKCAVLDITEIHEETESIENRQRLMKCQQSPFPFLKSIVVQTVPLFKPPYLKSTMITTAINFSIFYVCNGVYIFLTEILNRLMNNVDDFFGDRIFMCEAINLNTVNASSTPDENECVTKLEVGAMQLAVLLELIYAFSFFVIGVIINYVTKKNIIFTVFIVSSLSAIATMLTNIPILQMAFFFTFLSIGVVMNVVSAIMIELYPTALRAMAVNILMVAGRFGGVVGSNVTAILVDSYCEYAFYVPGCLFTVVAFLVFLIPYKENSLRSNKVSTSNSRASENSSYETVIL